MVETLAAILDYEAKAVDEKLEGTWFLCTLWSRAGMLALDHFIFRLLYESKVNIYLIQSTVILDVFNLLVTTSFMPAQHCGL